jgi:hypothetical protein
MVVKTKSESHTSLKNQVEKISDDGGVQLSEIPAGLGVES